MPPSARTPRFIFHIATADDWRAAQARGVYDGSALCRRDGFIHMSTREQVDATLARYFAGRDDIVLLAAETAPLAPRLRWEDVPGKGVFPHHYGALDVAWLRELGRVGLGADGRPRLPVLPPENEVST
jgi:uncharacterized protein (DUF952 family)